MLAQSRPRRPLNPKHWFGDDLISIRVERGRAGWKLAWGLPISGLVKSRTIAAAEKNFLKSERSDDAISFMV
jgi:hypothetical protein